MSLDINVNVYHCHDLTDSMRSFVMGLFEDLSAKIDDAKQASVDEHTQVMAAIDALKGGVGSDTSLNLTADQKTQLLSKLDDLTAAVKGVFDDSTTTETGTTDTGTTGTGTTDTGTGTTPPIGITPPTDPTTGLPTAPTGPTTTDGSTPNVGP
jgi:hypothetical protein